MSKQVVLSRARSIWLGTDWLLIVLTTFGLAALYPTSAFSQPSSTDSQLASLYKAATKSFAANDFEAASRNFDAALALCPNSELGLQCEYFAAISRWNLQPTEQHATSLADWLRHARQFEIQTEAKGDRIVSKSWNQWIEAAHLILAKSEIGKNQMEAAIQRLQRLLRVQDNANDQGVFKEIAWPRDHVGSANAWLELGFLSLRSPSTTQLASDCFDNAIQQCPESETKLLEKALWGCAQSASRLEQWEKSITHLSRLLSVPLDNEMRIRAKLLETKIKLRQTPGMEIARSLDSLVDQAMDDSLSDSTVYELAVTFEEIGRTDKANELFLQLSHRTAASSFVLEARIRVAREAALKSDWKTVLTLTQGISASDVPFPWNAFAQYFQGKSLLQTGETQRGLETLSAVLPICSKSKELETSVRLELSEAYYLSEKMDRAAEHLTWLTNEALQAKTKPTWLPRVLLRQGEVLANRNQWQEAEQLVSAICSDFPKWCDTPEVDYLLARCRVAQAEFDAARSILTKIMDSSSTIPSNQSIAARAGWMMGETFMMQRRYGEAITTYQRVLAIPNQDYWHAACATQLGLCAELGQDPATAYEWYQKVSTSYKDTPFASTAQRRLAKIASDSQQSQRIGSGTKR